VNETTRRLLYWIPRILCIAFAVFLGIFALDVFGMPVDFWHKALALLMHMVPTAVVLVVLAIVWRREWIGAVLFPLLAVFHLVTMRGRLDWSGYAAIDGPLQVLGVLFLVNWWKRATLRPKGA
jgi:hypothetical protein